MATVTKKDAKRYRMQFTVSGILHAKHEACKALAAKRGATFDLSDDFYLWCNDQLDQVLTVLGAFQDVQPAVTARQPLVPAAAAVVSKPAIFTPATRGLEVSEVNREAFVTKNTDGDQSNALVEETSSEEIFTAVSESGEMKETFQRNYEQLTTPAGIPRFPPMHKNDLFKSFKKKEPKNADLEVIE